MKVIERYFRLRDHQTTLTTELRAGVTSFMAMAYIIFANPAILSAAGVPFGGAVVATCFTAGLLCILMGLATNYPLCLAAGMGLNAVVAFTIVLGMEYTWQTAMGVIVIEGLLVLVLSATVLRQAMMDAIPSGLKYSIAVAIGLFITFIGLQEGGLVKAHPVTLVTFGDFRHPVALLSLCGLLVTGWLVVKQTRGALLWGIIVAAGLGMLPIWHLPVVGGAAGEGAAAARWTALIPLPTKWVDLPRDWSTFFAFDLKSAFTLALAPVIFACLMTDFFDTIGTAIAVGSKARYLDENGRIPKVRRLLVVDALGAVAGGTAGASSNTSYIESATGASEGGRTGLTAVVCGVLFLAALFFTPVVAIIGGGVEIEAGVVKHPVTAAALIIVGFLMMESVRHIRWEVPEEGLPAFLTLVTMPFTFSISHGIGAGFVSYAAWKLLTGKAREVSVFLWVAVLLFVVVFSLGM